MATSPHDPIPFIEASGKEIFPTLKALSDAGFDSELAKLIRSSPTLATQWVAALYALPGVPTDSERAYAAHLHALLAPCGFSSAHIPSLLRFPESAFTDVGEGHVVGAPINELGTGHAYWDDAQVDAWLAEQAKEGREAATIGDGIAFLKATDRSRLHLPLALWGSRSKDGEIGYLCGHGRGGIMLVPHSTNPIPGRWHKFLLRKIKKG